MEAAMITAKTGKEIKLSIPNTPGELGKVAKLVAEKGINVLSVCCCVIEDTGLLQVITDDNLRASDTLRSHGYELTEKDAVVVECTNSPGMLKHIATKLAGEDINIIYVHATTPIDAEKCVVILDTSNNERAVVLLHE
jgi:hypothetical protein